VRFRRHAVSPYSVRPLLAYMATTTREASVVTQ
jgi:hypothetical protein